MFGVDLRKVQRTMQFETPPDRDKFRIVEWFGWPHPSPTGWVAVSNGVRPVALFETIHDAERFIRGLPA
jgi:hypothetical protein